jgi:biotin carboxyl carrier protein
VAAVSRDRSSLPDRPAARIVDPRAVRVALAPSTGAGAVAPIVMEPAAVPLAPAPRIAGAGVLGGIAAPSMTLDRAQSLFDGEPGGEPDFVLVDDAPMTVRLERQDALHAILVEGRAEDARRSPVMMLPLEPASGAAIGLARREIVVDGWRIEVEIESERRVSLRERARRGREETAHGGPTEVRAIIPGRVVSVSFVAGDSVVAGQQLLVVEAMKMQNELRAPRDGVIASLAVGPGSTIEVGDLLLVLE